MGSPPDPPNELADLVGPFWSQRNTCEALDVTPDVLVAMSQDHRLLALVSADGVTVYPVWQFHRRDELVEVKPSLLPVLDALSRFDGWTVAVLLHTPATELNGSTPLDWLAGGGHRQAVLTLASTIVDEWTVDTRDP